MGDLPQLVQSIFIGLFFSFIIAKLISIAISYKDVNNRVSNQENNNNNNTSTDSTESKRKPKSVEITTESQQSLRDSETKKVEDDKLITDKEKRSVSSLSTVSSVTSSSVVDEEDDDDEDWEGVEYTELDEIFSAATAFVAASASDRLSQKVSNENQLQLYGFYKIATEGSCHTPQPSALNMSARAKWNAWQKLGSMPPEEAMQNYIALVSELYPSWAAGSAAKRKGGDSNANSSDSKSMMGPVFSSYVYEEDSQNEAKLEAVHECAREGEIDNLHKYLETGVSVNLKDSEGRTPLHWAVDRGHTKIVELLLTKNADVNAKDNDGQTPLHYAAVCERDDIANLLVAQKADRDLKDNEGNSPTDYCETNSSWMKSQ